MSKDPRDEANTTTDVFGDMSYVSEDGTKTPVRDQAEAERMKKLEDRLRREHLDPMGK